jgi:hypothetical protein
MQPLQKLLIRHLLDAMHCEKNLCENMVRTTFGQKDSYGSRQDMESTGIRRNLWLQPSQRRADVFHKPEAPYVLNAAERTTMVEIIRELKTPSNYVGAIYKCLEQGKLRYMKSHDFHVLMHEVRLPYSRVCAGSNAVLFLLSTNFRDLRGSTYTKVLNCLLGPRL